MNQYIELIEESIALHDKLTTEYNRSMSQLTAHSFWGEEREREAYDNRTDRLIEVIARAVRRIERRMERVTYAVIPNDVDPARQGYMLKFFVNGRCERTDRFPRDQWAPLVKAIGHLTPMQPEPYWKWKTDETIGRLRKQYQIAERIVR